MTRRTMLRPKLSRQIAQHVIENVWGEHCHDYEQVQPGVFVNDNEEALVVIGGSQISDAGVNALRIRGRLWELLVLQEMDKPPIIRGPQHAYSAHDWRDMQDHMLSLTRDVEAVLSTFEVMGVCGPDERADLGAASAIVGDALPTDTQPDPAMLEELLRQVDLISEQEQNV